MRLRGTATMRVVGCRLRRVGTASSGTDTSSPSLEAPPDGSSTALPQKKKFSSTIRFSIPDGKVTSDNVPTLEELHKMVPTLEELRKQLPSAKEMERKYVFGSTSAQQVAAEKSNASGENNPLWPNCDTPEDIMDEERYGADGEERAAPTSEQVSLAWKALAWGTVYAVIGVGALSVVGLKVCGFSSVQDLKDHLSAREERERAKLRASVESTSTDGSDLQHFVLDLTNPADVPRQIQEIYEAVQRLAEKESTTDS